ncbi:hypothetical protein TNCV_4318281 [Trichonephila clavipes]|nr:hypothetical protein TNCV_4318281 [Trichonephila clavipes]
MSRRKRQSAFDKVYQVRQRKDSGLPKYCGLSFREIGSRVGRNQTTFDIYILCFTNTVVCQPVCLPCAASRKEENGVLGMLCVPFGLRFAVDGRQESRGVISEPNLLTTTEAEIIDGFSDQDVIQVVTGRYRIFLHILLGNLWGQN